MAFKVTAKFLKCQWMFALFMSSSSESPTTLLGNLIWWCITMSQSVMQVDWFAFFKVRIQPGLIKPKYDCFYCSFWSADPFPRKVTNLVYLARSYCANPTLQSYLSITYTFHSILRFFTLPSHVVPAQHSNLMSVLLVPPKNVRPLSLLPGHLPAQYSWLVATSISDWFLDFCTMPIYKLCYASSAQHNTLCCQMLGKNARGMKHGVHANSFACQNKSTETSEYNQRHSTTVFLLTGACGWLTWRAGFKSSVPVFDSWTRQGEGLFWFILSQHLCRLVSACLAFLYTAHTKIVEYVKSSHGCLSVKEGVTAGGMDTPKYQTIIAE